MTLTLSRTPPLPWITSAQTWIVSEMQVFPSKQPHNLLLRWKRYSTDQLTCELVKEASPMPSMPHRGNLVEYIDWDFAFWLTCNIKRSILNLLHCNRRLCGCFNEKLASPEDWGTMTVVWPKNFMPARSAMLRQERGNEVFGLNNGTSIYYFPWGKNQLWSFLNFEPRGFMWKMLGGGGDRKKREWHARKMIPGGGVVNCGFKTSGWRLLLEGRKEGRKEGR